MCSSDLLELALKGLTLEITQAAQVALAPVPAPKPSLAAPRKSARQRAAEDLPLRHQQTLIPEEVRQNPEAWRQIDQSVTTLLDYEPGRLVRDEIIRPRFVRKDPASEGAPAVVAAPLPNRLIERGLPGPGLLSFIILERFHNHQIGRAHV